MFSRIGKLLLLIALIGCAVYFASLNRAEVTVHTGSSSTLPRSSERFRASRAAVAFDL